MKKILILFMYFGFLLAIRGEAQELLSTHDLREQIELWGLEFSPDGKHVLVLTSRQNYDSNDFLTELVMIDIGSKEQRTLSRRSGSPRPHGPPKGIEWRFSQL